MAAAERLGVPSEDVLLLGYEDGHLRLWTDEVAAFIAELCNAEQPDDIFVPSRLDDNLDHIALNDALRRAFPRLTRPARVLEYPVWYWVHGPWRAHRIQNALTRQWGLFVDPVAAALQRRTVAVATDGYLDTKLAAIDEYASQFTNLTGEADWAVLDQEFVGQFITQREVFFPWTDREV
jgi:LmbE family N-acetylglucosaminyl deacetylase